MQLMTWGACLQAWLNPAHLPSKPQLTCQVTQQPLNFLMQVDFSQATHADISIVLDLSC